MAKAVAVIAGLLALSGAAHAQGVPADILCRDLAGTVAFAPRWQAQPDGARGQTVLLQFRGHGQLGTVTWRKDGEVYHEASGIGVAMKTGFALLAFSDEFTESYVFSAGAAELYYSMTRAGNTVIPNSFKMMRGTCEGAANRNR
jgi:hypothetical protein